MEDNIAAARMMLAVLIIAFFMDGIMPCPPGAVEGKLGPGAITFEQLSVPLFGGEARRGRGRTLAAFALFAHLDGAGLQPARTYYRPCERFWREQCVVDWRVHLCSCFVLFQIRGCVNGKYSSVEKISMGVWRFVCGRSWGDGFF